MRIPTLRQEIDVVLHIDDYTQFFSKLYHNGLRANFSFIDRSYKPYAILSEKQFITILERQPYCSIAYKDFEFSIWPERVSAKRLMLTFKHFSRPCFTNTFLNKKDYIYLIKYDLLIPIVTRLVSDFLIDYFQISVKDLILYSMVNEEPERFAADLKSIICRLHFGIPITNFKKMLSVTLQENKYQCVDENGFDITSSNFLSDHSNEYLRDQCYWLFIKTENHYIKCLFDSGLIILRPLDPIKTIIYDGNHFIDIPFYLKIFTNIIKNASISEIKFNPYDL